ncbi:hypothetical protein JW962_03635 [Candidatus Dojkabacteria bacterium]|nr:hypothetical protein [Candidatus Dojkabacteria bacterium]
MPVDEISKRQLAILHAVISEFLGRDLSAVPSSIVVRRYKINACPATVRNEMAQLEKHGLLKKSHISSGRVPSDLGIKYFLRNILTEVEIPQEFAQSVETAITESTGAYERLTNISTLLSVYIDEPVFCFFKNITITKGLYRVSKYEELLDSDTLTSLLHFLENKTHFDNLVKNTTNVVFTIIGKDLKYLDLENIAIVAKKFTGKNGTPGYIGVISSKRFNYSKVIPAVRFIGDLLDNKV